MIRTEDKYVTIGQLSPGIFLIFISLCISSFAPPTEPGGGEDLTSVGDGVSGHETSPLKTAEQEYMDAQEAEKAAIRNAEKAEATAKLAAEKAEKGDSSMNKNAAAATARRQREVADAATAARQAAETKYKILQNNQTTLRGTERAMADRLAQKAQGAQGTPVPADKGTPAPDKIPAGAADSGKPNTPSTPESSSKPTNPFDPTPNAAEDLLGTKPAPDSSATGQPASATPAPDRGTTMEGPVLTDPNRGGATVGTNGNIPEGSTPDSRTGTFVKSEGVVDGQRQWSAYDPQSGEKVGTFRATPEVASAYTKSFANGGQPSPELVSKIQAQNPTTGSWSNFSKVTPGGQSYYAANGSLNGSASESMRWNGKSGTQSGYMSTHVTPKTQTATAAMQGLGMKPAADGSYQIPQSRLMVTDPNLGAYQDPTYPSQGSGLFTERGVTRSGTVRGFAGLPPAQNQEVELINLSKVEYTRGALR